LFSAFVQVCVPPVGRVPVQAMLEPELDPLVLEPPELEAPELVADEDGLELELPPVETWLELDPEVVELPAVLPPVVVGELVCEVPPELPAELEPPVAPALVPELELPLSLNPGFLVDELHAAESATIVGRRLRRRNRIRDLSDRERSTKTLERAMLRTLL
jgi:hypothetical protein